MKKAILFLFVIIFAGCEKSEQIKPYTFKAWIENKELHINYHNETVKGYVIWVTCDGEHEKSSCHDVQKFTSNNYGCDKTTSLYYPSTVVDLETDQYNETITVQ